MVTEVLYCHLKLMALLVLFLSEDVTNLYKNPLLKCRDIHVLMFILSLVQAFLLNFNLWSSSELSIMHNIMVRIDNCININQSSS